MIISFVVYSQIVFTYLIININHEILKPTLIVYIYNYNLCVETRQSFIRTFNI